MRAAINGIRIIDTEEAGPLCLESFQTNRGKPSGEGTVTSGLTGHNRRDGGNCLQIVPCKPAGQLICPRSS